MSDRQKEPVMPELDNADFRTDLGFGDAKQVNQPQQAQPTQPAPKPQSLEASYEFWQRNQSPANMHQLLQAADSVIGKAITQYAGGDKAMRAKAKRLAIKAFQSFDPKQGAKLKTHLMIRLRPLQREYTKRTSPLNVPERVQLDQLRLRQAESRLNEELGREPSDVELAEHMGLSTKRIAHVRSYSKGVLAESQMRSPEGELQLPASEHVTADDVWVEYVHHDLDAKDKKIMEWKTGYNGHAILSTNEIAKRLKMSPSAVSQRAAKIARKLESAGGEIATG